MLLKAAFLDGFFERFQLQKKISCHEIHIKEKLRVKAELATLANTLEKNLTFFAFFPTLFKFLCTQGDEVVTSIKLRKWPQRITFFVTKYKTTKKHFSDSFKFFFIQYRTNATKMLGNLLFSAEYSVVINLIDRFCSTHSLYLL